jgi:hypothetical protein
MRVRERKEDNRPAIARAIKIKANSRWDTVTTVSSETVASLHQTGIFDVVYLVTIKNIAGIIRSKSRIMRFRNSDFAVNRTHLSK